MFRRLMERLHAPGPRHGQRVVAPPPPTRPPAPPPPPTGQRPVRATDPPRRPTPPKPPKSPADTPDPVTWTRLDEKPLASAQMIQWHAPQTAAVIAAHIRDTDEEGTR